MSIFSKKQTGDIGEDYAVKYLKKHGYKIIERNYRKKIGEIDIIAKRHDYLVFVEVKTRHCNPLTKPYEAVNLGKQRKIIKTAALYIAEHKLQTYMRFDVCEVYVDAGTLKLNKINYIKNAFERSDYDSYY